jgi:hypothetical protein
MAVNDIFQVNVQHVLGGREVSNVFYYREKVLHPHTPTVAASSLCFGFYQDIWSVWWNRVIAADVQLVSMWGRKIWPTLEQAGQVLFSGDFGTVVGEAVPNGACVLLSAHDATNDPHWRRRMYISGLPESHQRGSQVVLSFMSDWNALADHVTEDEIIPPGVGSPGTYKPCAYSKALALEAGPTPWAEITFKTAQQSIRSQRGRNRRHVAF